MEKIKKFQSTLAKATLWLSAIILGTVTIALFSNVLGRYVFYISMMWVEQYARYMLIWSVFLAANVLVYNNDLIRVDFLDNFWPASFTRVREAVYSLIFIVMLSVLCYEGWIQAQDNIGVSLMGFNIDKFWVYLSVPAGAVFMMLQYLLNLIVVLFDKPHKKGNEGGPVK